MDNNLKKSIIMEHYQRPLNKGLVDDESYEKININSPTCIDNINYMIKIEDGIIEDVKFDGEACAISTSASSIILDMIKGKSKEDALNIINNYEAMINEKPYDKDIFKEALVYDEIYKQANRKKCALMPYEAVKEILEKDDDNV